MNEEINAVRVATHRQHEWLSNELRYWQARGVIDTEAVATITNGYQFGSGVSLIKLALGLGGAFAGIGLIWLVAANLDELSPLVRFAIVTALWLASMVAVWWFDRSPLHRALAVVVQAIAALAFGAVIMQAAQSLQVPAFEPRLVGLWSIGALLLAYVVRGIAPLLVGIITGVVWLVWELAQGATGPQPVIIGLLAAGVLAASVAAFHGRWERDFAMPWRLVGVGLSLVGLFAAAVPNSMLGQTPWTPRMIACCVIAAAAAAATTWLSREPGLRRVEPVLALGVMILGTVLVSWPAGNDPSRVTANDWAHSAVAVIGFVAAATWFATVAILRESNIVMVAAVGALVAFVTFQSFAVFARLIQGGWLFVILGVVFIATGFLADRGRRELAESLTESTQGAK